MPIVSIVLLEGRNQAQKDAMYAEVSQALCRTLSCPPEQVRIMVQDSPARKLRCRRNVRRSRPRAGGAKERRGVIR